MQTTKKQNWKNKKTWDSSLNNCILYAPAVIQRHVKAAPWQVLFKALRVHFFQFHCSTRGWGTDICSINLVFRHQQKITGHQGLYVFLAGFKTNIPQFKAGKWSAARSRGSFFHINVDVIERGQCWCSAHFYIITDYIGALLSLKEGGSL